MNPPGQPSKLSDLLCPCHIGACAGAAHKSGGVPLCATVVTGLLTVTPNDAHFKRFVIEADD